MTVSVAYSKISALDLGLRRGGGVGSASNKASNLEFTLFLLFCV